MNRFYKTFSGVIAAVVISVLAAESCFAGVNVFTADNNILQVSEFDDVIIKDIIDESYDVYDTDALDVYDTTPSYGADEWIIEDSSDPGFSEAIPEGLNMPASLAPEPAGAMPALLTIESPKAGEIVGNTLNVSGWALYTTDGINDGIFRIEVQINGNLLGVPTRHSRQDLQSSCPGYGNYSNAGFSLPVDLSAYGNGSHTLFVRIWSSNFNILTTRTITFYKQVQSGKPLVYNIDNPKQNQLVISDSLDISGWALYTPNNVTNGISRVDVSLNNVAVTGDADLYERNDLIAHFPDYPFYDKAGFTKNISLAGLAHGFHTVTVRFWGVNGQLLDSYSVSINYREPQYKPLLFNIDTPAQNEVVYNSVTISGWALFTEDGINNGIKYIDMFIDGTAIGEPEYFERGDLVTSVPYYGDYSRAGFSKTISMEEHTLGWRTVTGNIYDLNDNIIGTLSVTFNLQSNIPRPFVGVFDTPAELGTVKDTLTISGWALLTNNGVTNEIAVTEILISGMWQGMAVNLPRPDLEDTVKGYGDYSRAGFMLEISTAGMAYGKHTVTAKFYNSSNVLVGTISRDFFVSSEFAKPFVGSIDNPVQGQNVNANLEVSGWALHTNDGINNSIRRLDVLINGISYGEPVYSERADLKTAVPNYGDYSRSGFEKNINISGLSIGEHVLTVRAFDLNGTAVGELTSMFTRSPSLAKPFVAHFDTPYNGQVVTGRVNVSGWGLYTVDGVTSGISHVQVLLDGQSVGYASHTARPDLYYAIPGYGDYSRSGFNAEVDTSGLIAGAHTITLKFFNTNFEVVGQIASEINVQPVSVRPYIGNIDTPSDNMKVAFGSTIDISGWAIYSIDGRESSIKRVEIIVDSVPVKDASFIARPDIGTVYPGYGDYSRAGFTASISTAGLERGVHNVAVRVWSNANQALGIMMRTIIIE